jgi:tRNA pseudouridine55 synthase/H/ACA ribonucleoprotein complex subunit 4
MIELRRSRSGSFGEESMRTLHEVQDACVAAKDGDRSALTAMILSVDGAVPELPTVIVRDTAVDALCHGAKLANIGITSVTPFNKGQMVAVLSQKKEFICLGKALNSSSAVKPGASGLIVAPTSVFMVPGTYPRGWKKSCKPEQPGKSTANKR